MVDKSLFRNVITMPFFLRLVFVGCSAFPLVFLAGCGVTGGTSARTITLHPALATPYLSRTVLVGTVTARPDAAVNRAIGAYNFGKFDDSDLATLRETLRRSLPAILTQKPAEVHLVAQHFGLTFTNNRVAGLAIIDWCMVDGTNIVVSERFYAAYDSGDKLFGTETLGMAKNRILHAAAARVAERSLAAANALPVPPAPPLTFDDPATATATLPAHLTAVGAPGLVSAAVQKQMLGGLDGATRLLPNPLPPPIDWHGLLISPRAP